jgi:hypothetical protein
LPLRALLFFILPVSMKARTLGWGIIIGSLLCAVFRIMPQIGHLAHLGGAVAGALLTRWWAPVPRPRYPAVGPARTEALLQRVMDEGLEGLSRDERKALEKLAEKQPRRW